MFNHYLSTAWGNFSRHKTTTFISVLGLSLGLACFIASLSFVILLTSGDSYFAKSNRTYVITESLHPRGTQNMDFAFVRSSPPVAKHLRIDFPQLGAVATARELREIPVTADQRTAYLQAAAVDIEFLRIFDFQFLETTSTNPLALPRGAVVTQETAQRLFGTPHALGRTIQLENAFDVTITGVIRSVAQPSHMGTTPEHLLRFDILLTEDTYWSFRRTLEPTLPPTSPLTDLWGSPTTFTYALLPADGSFTARMLNEQLDSFTRRHAGTSQNYRLNFKHTAVPLANLPLSQLDAELFHGNGLSLATLILLLASVVLGIACVNYANLSTAKTLSRAQELALRRVLGASGIQVAAQQWMEGALQLVASALLALLFVMISVVWIVDDSKFAIGTVISSVQFWLYLGGVCIAIVAALGAYTAFAILRTHPAPALRRSEIHRGTGLAARVLVGVQFATASVLFIGLVVVQSQNSAIRDQALRATADPIVVLEFPSRGVNVAFATLKETLLRNSAIRYVSAITRTPWSAKQVGITSFSRTPDGKLINTLVDFVRFDFERAFDRRILAGRAFDTTLGDVNWNPRTASAGHEYRAVIDQATAKQFGWSNPSDAIGQSFYQLDKNGAPVPIKVIGVIENSPLRFDAYSDARGQVYALQEDIASNVVVRIDKNRIADALATIDTTWKQLAPYAPIKRRFLDELFEREYQTLARVGDVLSAITSIGTTIAAVGLFGMATFIITRRRREIGVRKTLGASVRQIISMLLRDFSKPVLVANILVWPLGYIAAQKYLNTFVQRIDLTLLPFLASLTFTLLIAWTAVSAHAWRAARANPSEVLRHE